MTSLELVHRLDLAFEDARLEAVNRCRRAYGDHVVDGLLQEPATLRDVLSTVEKALAETEGGGKRAKFLRGLASFAKKVDIYTRAIDVYANASPEVASLVWGSCRVLLQVTDCILHGLRAN